ncbi:MAG TPA: hypothetical protein VFU12_03615 [Glycomyces sp.]|nr:hypothetical protein [Glycomyces sp.]
MNEDLEELLRAELAGRADSAPMYSGEGLADAAITGAGRIRRRRRIGAAAGGLGLVLVGAAAAVWLPFGDAALDDAPPVATSAEEAQSDLDLEFVVERDGAYGVVNVEGEYVPLAAERRPDAVQRLQTSYVVSSTRQVEVTALDGAATAQYELPVDQFYTTVSGDAEAFAVQYYEADEDRQVYELFPGDPQSARNPAVLDLALELNLEDWNEDLLVFSSDLVSVTGGASVPHYFNDQYDWGLETAAEAGYESVVVADPADPGYVCVADLDPGSLAAPDSEDCGYLDELGTADVITQASGDAAAAGLVQDVADSFDEEVAEVEVDRDGPTGAQLFDSEYRFVDPFGRWEIGFSAQDETWALLDLSGGEAVVSELRPPRGALLPVVSHS